MPLLAVEICSQVRVGVNGGAVEWEFSEGFRKLLLVGRGGRRFGF